MDEKERRSYFLPALRHWFGGNEDVSIRYKDGNKGYAE